MGGKAAAARTRAVDDSEKDRFRNVLADTVAITERETIPYGIGGSLCSNHWGRPSSIGDIDLLVQPQDAERLLVKLEAAGFETEKPYPQWLFKATREGVTVDIIFEI